jgi:hypothetical protein
MRIVCDKCGASAEAAKVEVVAGSVWVTCGTCGKSSELGATGSHTAVEPVVSQQGGAEPVDLSKTPSKYTPRSFKVHSAAFVGPPLPSRSVPPVKCPKCGHRQHNKESCHKCGLVFANVRPGDKPWERFAPEKMPAIRVAREIWARLEANPADAALHEEFLKHCRTSGVAEFAALRYRHWVSDHPDDELSVRSMEQAIKDAQLLVQALALNPNTEFVESATKFKKVVLGVSIVLGIVIVYFLIRLMSIRSHYTV